MIGQIYLHYDEESLALHSNAGLIRRAKKSLEEVQLIEGNTAPLQFKVEEFEVCLPEQGITEAQCNCPAQSCCKHILSSIFWLQQNQHITQTTIESTEQNNTHEHLETAKSPALLAENMEEIATESVVQNSALNTVLALKDSTLFKKIGKAQTRLAFEIWENFCENKDSCSLAISSEKISFKTTFSENPILFFPPTAFDGILSDINDNKKNAVHLACIAYVFHLHAPEQWQWPEDLKQQLHLNHPYTLTPEDVEFIQELQQLCQHFIQQGLSHIAKESVLSLHILNMQARAQNLPRLATQLRQLHGMMQQLLEDDFQMDEQQIFSQLAYLNAYLFALQNSQNQAKNFKRLKGTMQRDYQEQRTERLIPLGCEWWQTDSGAQGLTLTFWDVEQQHSREVTQARANRLDSTFDKNSVAQTGIWGTSLDYLLRHQIQLNISKASSEVNLSASSDTRFTQLASFQDLTLDDFQQLNIGVSRWSDLVRYVQPTSSLEQNPYRYVLLRHQQIDAPELNEQQQCFECRIQDDDACHLKLTLPIEIEYQVRIKHLTTLMQQNEKIVATLVRLDSSQQNIQLIPCSVILQKKQHLEIFSLDYHHPSYKKSSLAELITGRIEKLLQQKKQWQTQQHYSALDIAIWQTQSVLEFYANTGRAVLDPQDKLKLQHAAQLYEDLGLAILQRSIQTGIESDNLPATLLKWRHLFLQIQRLSSRLPL